jgi:hypothetical protein
LSPSVVVVARIVVHRASRVVRGCSSALSNPPKSRKGKTPSYRAASGPGGPPASSSLRRRNRSLGDFIFLIISSCVRRRGGSFVAVRGGSTTDRDRSNVHGKLTIDISPPRKDDAR